MHVYLVVFLYCGGVLAVRIHPVIAVTLLAFLAFTSFLLGVRRDVEATPITLDFESLRQDNARINQQGTVVSEDGFTVTALSGELNTAGTLDPSFPGSTALFQGISASEIALTPTVGGPFDSVPFNLLSIDLVELPNFIRLPNGEVVPLDLGQFDITFFGTTRNGTTVTNTFTITNFFTTETFSFRGFTNLVSVNWFQGGGGEGNQTHQFDNIVIRPIPEPSTMLLLGSGLAGLGWYRRRRKKVA